MVRFSGVTAVAERPGRSSSDNEFLPLLNSANQSNIVARDGALLPDTDSS